MGPQLAKPHELVRRRRESFHRFSQSCAWRSICPSLAGPASLRSPEAQPANRYTIARTLPNPRTIQARPSGSDRTCCLLVGVNEQTRKRLALLRIPNEISVTDGRARRTACHVLHSANVLSISSVPLPASRTVRMNSLKTGSPCSASASESSVLLRARAVPESVPRAAAGSPLASTARDSRPAAHNSRLWLRPPRSVIRLHRSATCRMVRPRSSPRTDRTGCGKLPRSAPIH
jgi:hypothetical protein